jgi:hypothetical protein
MCSCPQPRAGPHGCLGGPSQPPSLTHLHITTSWALELCEASHNAYNCVWGYSALMVSFRQYQRAAVLQALGRQPPLPRRGGPPLRLLHSDPYQRFAFVLTDADA